MINHVISTESDFREYVLAYTNAPTIIGEEFADVDADGLFSGFDADKRAYDPSSWQYEGAFVAAAAGQRDQEGNIDALDGEGERGALDRRRAGQPKLDLTLQHPRCVWQILKRHYAQLHARDGRARLRHAAGCVREGLPAVRRELRARAHDGVRARRRLDPAHDRLAVHPRASILQLLLGNMGRPGGGVMAMRGHASIQGSSDIPTLFDTLPGYIPMPHAHRHDNLD